MSPVELFELFWDDPLIEEISEQMKIYHIQKGHTAFVPTAAELHVFLGMISISGHNQFSQCKLYRHKQKMPDVI